MYAIFLISNLLGGRMRTYKSVERSENRLSQNENNENQKPKKLYFFLILKEKTLKFELWKN